MKAFAAKRLNVSPSGHPLVLDSLPAKTPLTQNTSLRFFSSSLSPSAPFLVLLLAIASRELKASTTETQRRFYFPFGQRPRYAAGKNLYGESSPGNGMAYFAFFSPLLSSSFSVIFSMLLPAMGGKNQFTWIYRRRTCTEANLCHFL